MFNVVPLTPDGVDLRVGGRGRLVLIMTHSGAVELDPDDPEYQEVAHKFGVDFVITERTVHVGTASSWGSMSVFGFGAWIPFLLRRFATKLAVLDVLETVQELVELRSGNAWPVLEAKARVAVEGGAIRMWFEIVDGTTISVGMLVYFIVA